MKSRRKTHKQNHILFSLVSVLLILVLLSTSMLSGLYARYATTVTGGDSARVAKFDIRKEGSLISDLPLEYIPGDSGIYTLIITNRSEVTVKSTLSIRRLTDNLPLTLELDGTPFADETSVSLELAPNSAGTVTYSLSAAWPETLNAEVYSYELDAIRVQVLAEQID